MAELIFDSLAFSQAPVRDQDHLHGCVIWCACLPPSYTG